MRLLTPFPRPTPILPNAHFYHVAHQFDCIQHEPQSLYERNSLAVANNGNLLVVTRYHAPSDRGTRLPTRSRHGIVVSSRAATLRARHVPIDQRVGTCDPVGIRTRRALIAGVGKSVPCRHRDWLFDDVDIVQRATRSGGLAVMVSWMTLLIGRQCRSETTWLDRPGRAVGVCWIMAAFAMAVGHVLVWTDHELYSRAHPETKLSAASDRAQFFASRHDGGGRQAHGG